MLQSRHEAKERSSAWAARLGWALLALHAGACGTVSPTLPREPSVGKSAGVPSEIVVVGQGTTDSPLLREVERLLATIAPVRRGTPTQSIDALCTAPGGLVVRVGEEMPTFSSNATERNTVFIYESAIVVGIPVTLISAVAWPWYGQINTRGTIETAWCNGRSARTPAVAALRVDGRGFIGWPRIKQQLDATIGVALARKLVDAAAQCGRFERGKDLCVQ